MSQTPRTDALLTAILERDGSAGPANAPEDWVSLARTLERELAAAKMNQRNAVISLEIETAKRLLLEREIDAL